MKHLKKFNESLIDIDLLRKENDIELTLNYIDYYSGLLSFDIVFKDYLEKEFNKYSENDSLEDIVKKHPNPISIVEYAQKRYQELEEENRNSINQLEIIIEDIEDRSKYVKEFEMKDYSNGLQLFFYIKITLKKELIDQRYKSISSSFDYTFKIDEVKDLWTLLISAMSRIKSLGLEVNLDYRPNKDVINFIVKRTN